MTPADQVIEIKDFCTEILKAKGRQKANAWKKYLWKIEAIARDLRLLIESGDITEEKL